MPTTRPAKPTTVFTRGCDLSVVSTATLDAWRALYGYTALQVWTWRGGEALVCSDRQANYGRGLGAVVVRTGGTKRGRVQVLHVDCFAAAMRVLGIEFRNATGTRPRRERSRSEIMRAALALAARRAGHTFRTLRVRPVALAA